MSFSELATSTGSGVSAAIAALQASYHQLETDPESALSSIRRIVARIQHATLISGQHELAYTAGAVLEANTPADVARLAGRLIDMARQPGEEQQLTTTPRVLMIEDDRLTARVLADALQESGPEVDMAYTGAEARAKLAEHKYDLVLLDLVLPDADGRDLLVGLRGQASLRNVVILVVTARMDAGTQAECFALGANGVLSKPIHPDVLCSAVAAHLQQRTAQRRATFADSLTGLRNRAGFYDAIEPALAIARRQHQPVAIAMIDLDHFKSINDTHGHATGDLVLRRAGQQISTALRISDLVARWGGEEFCAFLPNTTLEGAVIALEKARAAVAALRLKGNDEVEFSVTFSAGAATIQPDQTVDAALEIADRRLYIAKATGRNRIVYADDVLGVAGPHALVFSLDDAQAEAVTRLLAREGFTVSRFTDARAMLQAVRENSYAAAVLDLPAPDDPGLEVVRQLRQQFASSALPILMLAGQADEGTIERAFETGVSDYLTKPFHAPELIARLRRVRKRR